MTAGGQVDCVVDDVLGDAVTDTTQPKRSFAHALGRIMDRGKPQGPDTNCSRKMHQVEASQRGSRKAQRGGARLRLRLPARGPVWTMPKLVRPGSCLLGKWQLAKLRRHLASTCFFSGSAVPPPNSNNWAAGRSRRSTPCGHLLGSVISHIPSIVHSLCQATGSSLSALSTTTAVEFPHPHLTASSVGIHSRYPSRSAPSTHHLAVLGKDAGGWN